MTALELDGMRPAGGGPVYDSLPEPEPTRSGRRWLGLIAGTGLGASGCALLVPGSPLAVVAELPGLATQSAGIALCAGSVGAFALALFAKRSRSAVFSVRQKACASKAAFVRKTVFVQREETGEFVADVILTLAEPDGRQVAATARTTADGECLFEKLEPGEYLLIASKPGFHPYAKLIEIDDEDSSVTIELSEELWLFGVVRSTGRGPLGGATVMLTDPAGDVAATARTLPDGSYRIAGALAPGAYTMTVTAKACRPAATVVQLPEGGNAEQDVEVIGGAYLAGTVAAPIFLVELVDARGQVVAFTSTDSDGRYRFTEIAEGDYTVRVSAPPSAEHSVSVTAGRLHQLDLTLNTDES